MQRTVAVDCCLAPLLAIVLVVDGPTLEWIPSRATRRKGIPAILNASVVSFEYEYEYEYEHEKEKEKDSIVESVAFLVTPIYRIGFAGTGTWPNNSK